MRRLLPPLLLLLLPGTSAVLADGCPPTTCGTVSVVLGPNAVVTPNGCMLAIVRPSRARAFSAATGQAMN
jgi:hypothetical protein